MAQTYYSYKEPLIQKSPDGSSIALLGNKAYNTTTGKETEPSYAGYTQPAKETWNPELPANEQPQTLPAQTVTAEPTSGYEQPAPVPNSPSPGYTQPQTQPIPNQNPPTYTQPPPETTGGYVEPGYTPTYGGVGGTPTNSGSGAQQTYMDEFGNYLKAAEGIGPEQYSITPPVIDPITGEVSEEELANYQLEKILASNSPLMKRAAQQGREAAAARGLMNWSIAAGNAQGAMIDRATPLAVDAAHAYQTRYGQNLAEQNTTARQNAANELQGLLASLQINAERDAQLRGAQLAAAEDFRRAGINVENREDTQRYGTSERIGSQNWQTGERLGSEAFQAAQNAANRAWQTSERIGSQEFQAYQNEANRQLEIGLAQLGYSFQQMMQEDEQSFRASLANLDAQLQMAGYDMQQRHNIAQALIQERANRTQTYGNAALGIYTNPNLTAGEQMRAVQNLPSLFNPVFNDPNYLLSLETVYGPPPEIPLLETGGG